MLGAGLHRAAVGIDAGGLLLSMYIPAPSFVGLDELVECVLNVAVVFYWMVIVLSVN